MAKRRVKKEVPLTRKQVSRREKERRQRLILIGIAVAVGCVIVVILGYGAYQELIAKPSAPVAIVNGVPITTQTYQKRVLTRRMQIDAQIQGYRAQQAQMDPEADAFYISLIDQQISNLSLERNLLTGESYLENLIDEELTRQAAEAQGVVVSEEEIDRRIEQYFGYSGEEPTPVPSPTNTITTTTELTPTEAPTPMTEARFKELYSDYLSVLKEGAGLSEAEYREMVRAEIVGEKMEEFVGQQVPTTELHIHARHILLDTEEEAEAVLQRLQQGEDFEVLATEVSTDTLTAEQGGDLGWLPRGQMGEAFDEVAFNLPVGEISDVVETWRGFHIIMVEERDESRELDPLVLDQRKREAFQVWLSDLKETAEIEKFWTPDKVPLE